MYQKAKGSHSFPSLIPVLRLAFLTFRGCAMCHVLCNGPAILIIPMEKEAYVLLSTLWSWTPVSPLLPAERNICTHSAEARGVTGD